jgi:hypothetical protein
MAQNPDRLPQNLLKTINLSNSKTFSTENMADNSPAFQALVFTHMFFGFG